MTLDQMASFKKGMDDRGRPGVGQVRRPCRARRPSCRPSSTTCRSMPQDAAAPRRRWWRSRAALPRPTDRKSSTQEGFGKILNAIAAEDSELARRIVTTSPDVTVSTNLGAWVNRRGLFGAHRGRGRVPRAEGRVGPDVAQDAARPAHRARHRREQPVHPARRARPQPSALRRAAAADRHALRSVHRPRPRCAELRLLPGCALHDRGHAVGRDPGARRRRAPDRSTRR